MMNPKKRAEIQMPIRHRPMPAASASALARVADALDAFCAAEGIPPGTAWRLHVAVDEIVTNIVTHGAAGGPVPGIETTFGRSEDVLEIVIADDGPAFDPLAAPDADVSQSLDGRQPGGLGIAIVKGLMDDVRYERTSRNVLTMRKRIGPADEPGEPQVV